jgi:glycosyltransferase involved in cell wall biosynthesis
MPLVTAAIPTYNRARFLPGALESVFAQTFTDYEVVVVDDGSTDDTSEVVAPYLDRIRYLRQENAGRSAARNACIRAAAGRYVSFLDSDDRWLPGKLERHVPLLEARPSVGMVHGHVDVIDDDDRPLPAATDFHHRLWSAAHRAGASYAGYALECRCFSTATTFRAEVFDRVGLYDESLALDDYELYLRVALDYEIVFLEESVAEYRYHGENMDSRQLTLGQIQGAEKHLRLLEERGDVAERDRARRNLHAMLARSYNVLGDQSAARRHALRALRPDALGVEMLKRAAVSFVR